MYTMVCTRNFRSWKEFPNQVTVMANVPLMITAEPGASDGSIRITGSRQHKWEPISALAPGCPR